MRARFNRYAIVLLLVNGVAIVALDQLAGAWTRVDPTQAFRRPHPAYHHDLRPSVAATTQWGTRRYAIRTNSLAFRDASTRRVAAAGAARRILLLGDSFTEGLGVTWEESFAGRLAGAAGPEVEILNAGVIGYSPRIYLAKLAYLLERERLEVDEVVVFIDMSDIPNEILYAVWEPRDEEPAPPTPVPLWQRLREGSLVARSIGWTVGPNRTGVAWNFAGMPFAEDLDAPALRDPAYDDGEHWTLAYPYAREGMALAASHMDALASLCAGRNLPLTIVIHPWPANVLAGELDHPQVDLWRSFAAARELDFIDLFPVFIRAGEDPRLTVAHYFIEGDVHWNAAGHELVASRIAPRLAIDPERP